MKIKRSRYLVFIPVTAFLFGAITACGKTETLSWKEEVALHDGSKIVVSRSMMLGGGRREPGAWTVGGHNYTLDFNTPDGRSVHWKNPGNLSLMVLGFEGGTPYLATSPSMVIDYTRYGCPSPAYVFLKYQNANWQRIGFQDFPVQFRQRNLSPESKEKRAVARMGLITLEQMRELVGEYSGLSREDREIDPNKNSPYPPCPRVTQA